VGVLDLTPTLSVVTGRSALIQKILRRLSTPAGSLEWDTTYGYDLRNEVGASVVEYQVVSRVSAQCLAEEEVEDVRVTVSLAVAGVLRVGIVLRDANGPFDFTVSIDQLTGELLVGEVQ
jgi:hypothetical protein